MNVSHEYEVDIQKPMNPDAFEGTIICGDGGCHRIIVTLIDNGYPADLSEATASLNIVRKDGLTVHTTMEINDNTISAAVPVEATAIPGRIYIMVTVTTPQITITPLYKYANVKEGVTGAYVDPGDTIPSLAELLAQVAAMSAATIAANEAAAAANEAAMQAMAASTRISIIGVYTTIELLTAGVAEPEIGDPYGVGAEAPYDVYIYTASGWVNFGKLMGTPAYVWIKWSAAMPTQDGDMKDTPDAYIGIYWGTTSPAPTTYTEYAWYPYLGPSGTSAYLHIRWGETNTPDPLLTEPNEWIGIAATSSPTAPATYTEYLWYNWKGGNGDTGVGIEPSVTVEDSSDTFACDLNSKNNSTFLLTIANTNAKTITFSNVPEGDCNVILVIKATSTPAGVTYTLNGDDVTWRQGSAISMIAGYTYYLMATYNALISKWVIFDDGGGVSNT